MVVCRGYKKKRPLACIKSSISPLPKRLVCKANLVSCLPRCFPIPASRSKRLQSHVILTFFSFRTSIAGSPSCAQAAAGSLPSLVPSLFLCLLGVLPRQLSRTHSSRGRARSGLGPTSSCRPSIQGPIALRACGGIGGERTSLRWQGP